jgi:hypothetical protein
MVLGIILAIHNLLRWVVLAAILFTLFRAYSGWLGKKAWQATDRLAGLIFSITIDVQLLLGIVLIFVRGFSVIQMRFYIEHIGMMILAVVLAHVGSALSKKADLDVDKHRKAAIWFTLTLLVILVSIPWTRPLLPF